MDVLISKVLAINTDTSKIIENQLQQMQTLTVNVNTISIDVENLKLENTVLKVANVKLTDKIVSLECYSRLNNLILHNVPEEQGSSTVMATVTNILTETMMILNVSCMLFDDVHRQGKPLANKARPIYFRLVRITDRHTIWSNRYTLKGTSYVIHEDLPESYVKARGQLRPVMTAAELCGKKASFNGDKLKVDGHSYGVDDIPNLPSHLNPETACTKRTNDVMKYIGDKVKADDETWKTTRLIEMHNAVKAKFVQNDKLKEYLLATGSLSLGEASTDSFWGIGSTLQNPQSLDAGIWAGNNYLGKILMRVRYELK
ncbi:hypothetical protein LSH36_587g00000 [Paralvinella palmiformis]|uniref:NADAR domain-containing protein n=1 Tax=Paralvinella palmiformis TaxID=53620 RepID=A0AAD9J503_9ANNE|nr:hypothetical protein LSH36_587g00000 [Paralvinella palmiformis]